MKEMKIKLDKGEYGVLICPNCGRRDDHSGDFLHHDEVEVGWRPEDRDISRLVSKPSGITTDVVGDSQYSWRRDYVVLRLHCETCGHEGMELVIRQYKGRTYMEWVHLGVPCKEEDDD